MSVVVRIQNGVSFSENQLPAGEKHTVFYARAANIKRYLSNSGHQWNEDVFWATVPQEFNYPPQDEALRFAFDTHPAYCYAQIGQHLPFGCHSWSKPRMFAFWEKIIPWEAQLKQEIQTS